MNNLNPPKISSATVAATSVGRYRWRICALLFFATTINYMDRSVLGVLGPTLQYKVFNWSDNDYANINIAFKLAYAIGMLSMGALIDRFGTKIGYTLSIAIWSLFGMLHAAVRPAFSLLGFSVARFGLGLGESGNFPAAIKTVGEHLHARLRRVPEESHGFCHWHRRHGRRGRGHRGGSQFGQGAFRERPVRIFLRLLAGRFVLPRDAGRGAFAHAEDDTLG